jgi:hypothetical protein
MKKIVIALVTAVIAVVGTIILGPTKTVERPTPVGAVSSLDGVDNAYVSIAGNKSHNFSIGIAATSSIVCSVKNPYTGTSTLTNFRMGVISVGGLGAQVFDLSTSTSFYGSGATYGSSTSPFLTNVKAPASAYAIVYYPTSSASGNSPQVGPGQYVNVRIATATPTAFTTYYSGTCSGEFYAITN